MATAKKNQAPLKPKPRAERAACLYCKRKLEPQFTAPPPVPGKLLDGRRKAEREAWEKENQPRFTGHYGRYNDDRFCGQACGYNYAVAHTRPARFIQGSKNK